MTDTAAKTIPDHSRKRGYAVKEIITTEHTYIERLKMAVDVFVKPLAINRVLDPAEIKKQFDMLGQIYAFHQNYLSLEENGFVLFFSDLCDHFELYAKYLVDYEPSMQKRGYLLTSNRKFADFIERTQQQPDVMNLESLLIMPVQRIPRYRLLLEQVLKYTPIEHPDHDVVKSCLEKICELATSNNEAIRARENHFKIMEIMMQIEPRSRVQLLDDENRKFIKESSLKRQCRKGLKDFRFWLFSDQLLYGEAIPLNPNMFTLNRQIPLAKCFVSPCESMTDMESSFIVESPAKSFIVKTKDEEEKKEWITAINDAIKTQQEKFSVERGIVAPLWHPDATTSACSRCKKVFSLLNRRHHCRNCGYVVCDACSSKRMLVQHVDAKREVRVCSSCFLTLTGAQVGEDEADDDDSDAELARGKLMSDEYADGGERSQVSELDLHDFNELCSDLKAGAQTLQVSCIREDETAVASSAKSTDRSLSPITARKSVFSEMLRDAAASAAESGTNFLTKARSKMNPTRPSIYRSNWTNSPQTNLSPSVKESGEASHIHQENFSSCSPSPKPVSESSVNTPSIGKVTSLQTDVGDCPTTPPPKPPKPGRKTQRRLNIVLSPASEEVSSLKYSKNETRSNHESNES